MPGPIAALISPGRLPKQRMHLAHTFLDDALDRAPPSGVKHAHGAAFGVDQNNGQAVGGLDAEQKAGSRGDQAVAD